MIKHILSFRDYINENKKDILNNLVELDIEILDKDKHISNGKLIIHKDIKDDIISIFRELKDIGYPIESMKPIFVFNNNDDESMEHNNTYSYCHRYIRYTKILSAHSYGLCIDLNPRYNPCVRFDSDGKIKSVFPINGKKYADRNIDTPYKITDEVVDIFKKYGFSWGGDWKTKKDYHHFERRDLINKYRNKL